MTAMEPRDEEQEGEGARQRCKGHISVEGKEVKCINTHFGSQRGQGG